MANSERRVTRPSVLMTGAFHDTDAIFDCVVLNISTLGAKVRFVGDPPDGLEGTLRLRDVGGFDAKIVWREDNVAGLEFIDTPADFVETIGKFLPVIEKER